MNEFSILCRVLGSLYYRQPQDPLLVPLFTLIREGKLAANWPLEQDELLPGWKISQRKMRAKHWKHCSVSICYPGVVRSSAKWRPMQPRLSGAPWHR